MIEAPATQARAIGGITAIRARHETDMSFAELRHRPSDAAPTK
jgi:hypothetical protein